MKKIDFFSNQEVYFKLFKEKHSLICWNFSKFSVSKGWLWPSKLLLSYVTGKNAWWIFNDLSSKCEYKYMFQSDEYVSKILNLFRKNKLFCLIYCSQDWFIKNLLEASIFSCTYHLWHVKNVLSINIFLLYS